MPRFYVSIADANRILDDSRECLTLGQVARRMQFVRQRVRLKNLIQSTCTRI
jgi:hypothetical protein